MSLPTPSRFAQAKKLLESLDLNSLTRELVKRSYRERSIKEQFSELEKSLSLSPVAKMNRPFPLHITLSSLTALPTKGEGTMATTLVSQCHDSTCRLNHLFYNLTVIFAAAGLHDISSVHPHLLEKLKEARSSLSLPGVSLISTHLTVRKLVPSLNQPGKKECERPLKFNPRDLLRTFEDFVWAENIRLERLSICSLGLNKHIRKAGLQAQLQEACSVPLF